MVQWLHLEPSLEVLSRTSKAANKNPTKGFCREPFYISRLLSGTHAGGSTENRFVLWHKEPWTVSANFEELFLLLLKKKVLWMNRVLNVTLSRTDKPFPPTTVPQKMVEPQPLSKNPFRTRISKNSAMKHKELQVSDVYLIVDRLNFAVLTD